MNESNPNYEGDTTEVAVSWNRLESVMGRTDDRRALVVKSWRDEKKKPAEASISILPPCDDEDGEGDQPAVGSTERMRSLYKTMATYNIDSNFSDYLLDDETFEGMARVSVGTEEEKCFKAIASLDEEDEVLFNLACQQMILTAFTSLDKSIMQKSGHKQSFWWHQHDFITSKKFQDLRKLLPASLSQSHLAAAIVEQHLARLFSNWLDEAIIDTFTSPSDSSTAAITTNGNAKGSIDQDEENSEVTNFVGWAMKEVLDQCREKWQDSESFFYEEDNEDEDENTCENSDRKAVLHVKSMRLLHREAIKDAGHLQKYYAPIDQIRNRGGLFLLAPQYVPFGRMVMKRTRELVNEKTIEEVGKEAIKEAYKTIISDEDLWGLFNKAENDIDLPEGEKKIIFTKIVKKAFHARAGEATRRYNEQQIDKADMALRAKLKATSGAKKKLDFEGDVEKCT